SWKLLKELLGHFPASGSVGIPRDAGPKCCGNRVLVGSMSLLRIIRQRLLDAPPAIDYRDLHIILLRSCGAGIPHAVRASVLKRIAEHLSEAVLKGLPRRSLFRSSAKGSRQFCRGFPNDFCTDGISPPGLPEQFRIRKPRDRNRRDGRRLFDRR